jgi:hypothetical protein
VEEVLQERAIHELAVGPENSSPRETGR